MSQAGARLRARRIYRHKLRWLFIFMGALCFVGAMFNLVLGLANAEILYVIVGLLQLPLVGFMFLLARVLHRDLLGGARLPQHGFLHGSRRMGGRGAGEGRAAPDDGRGRVRSPQQVDGQRVDGVGLGATQERMHPDDPTGRRVVQRGRPQRRHPSPRPTRHPLNGASSELLLGRQLVRLHGPQRGVGSGHAQLREPAYSVALRAAMSTSG